MNDEAGIPNHGRPWSNNNKLPFQGYEEISMEEPKATQKPSRKPKLRKPSSISLSWKNDILAWLGSCTCFVAIVVVLSELEGKVLPEMRFGLTPNAIISLLATFMELLLLSPVHSAIGQIKWLRALRQQPMDDFRVIDRATRSPWGSTILLAKRKGGVVASFGAVVFLLSLGIGTFVQQTLKYETVYWTIPDASTPVARSINNNGFGYIADPSGGPAIKSVPNQFIGIPYVALFSPPSTPFQATAQCRTGNCTWDPYPTLGICNTCQNLASRLNVTKVPVEQPELMFPDPLQWPNDTYQHLLPNGFGLTGLYNNPIAEGLPQLYEPILNITTNIVEYVVDETSRAYVPQYTAPWESIAFSKNESKLFSVFAVGTAPGTGPSYELNQSGSPMTNNSYENGLNAPVAFECMLQWCVRTIRGEFSDGTFRETEISRTPYTHTSTISQNSSVDYEDPTSKQKFSIPAATWYELGYWLSTHLKGNVQNNLGITSEPVPLNYSSAILEGIFRVMNDSDTAFPGLMDNLANSLSLGLRTLTKDNVAIGNSISSTSHAVVRWPWLILPILELLGSLVLLIIVLRQTKKQGLHSWSNNVLAFFFHGLDERPSDGKVYGSQTDMEDRAKGMLVELQPSQDGGRLVILNQ